MPGKVHSYPPDTPPGATRKFLYGCEPLEITSQNSPHDTTWTISDDKKLCIYRIKCGAGKDPSEKGAKIEVFYKDESLAEPEECLFDRFYVANETEAFEYFDRDITRCNIKMDGKTGGDGKLIIRRTRLSASAQEIDVVIECYEVDKD